MRGLKQRAPLPAVKAPRGCKYCLLGFENPLSQHPLFQHGHRDSLDVHLGSGEHCILCHKRGINIARLISETLSRLGV